MKSIVNTILWDNEGPGGAQGAANQVSPGANVTYSVIEGGAAGAGNLSTMPNIGRVSVSASTTPRSGSSLAQPTQLSTTRGCCAAASAGSPSTGRGCAISNAMRSCSMHKEPPTRRHGHPGTAR